MGMTQHDLEVRELELRLADLRHNFDDAAAPILNRLRQIRQSSPPSDKVLLIPKQARPRSRGVELPKQY